MLSHSQRASIVLPDPSEPVSTKSIDLLKTIEIYIPTFRSLNARNFELLQEPGLVPNNPELQLEEPDYQIRSFRALLKREKFFKRKLKETFQLRHDWYHVLTPSQKEQK